MLLSSARRFMVRLSCVLLVAVMACSITFASSVEQVSMAEVTKGSELIFRGRVLDAHSVREGTTAIFTRVTFQVLEIYKGPKVSNQIELDFMGGKLGTLELNVADMRFPKVGESGIYFVESLKRKQVHPLYGWQQGHFLISRDSLGTERVHTVYDKPVTSILADSPSRAAPAAPSEIIARGVLTSQSASPEEGMTVNEFKRRIQEIDSAK
jgi:hypothetical protein